MIIYQEIVILLKAIKNICMLLDTKSKDGNGHSLLNPDHRLRPISRERERWGLLLDPSEPAMDCAWLYPDGSLQTSNRSLKRKIFSCLFGSFILRTIFISML